MEGTLPEKDPLVGPVCDLTLEMEDGIDPNLKSNQIKSNQIDLLVPKRISKTYVIGIIDILIARYFRVITVYNTGTNGTYRLAPNWGCFQLRPERLVDS